MSIIDDGKFQKLQCNFPKLTEANQQYVLGLAEGLKHAQDKSGENPGNKPSLPRMGDIIKEEN